MQNEILSEETIRSFLTDDIVIPAINIHSVLKSTNITAKELAQNAAAHGTVVIADSQTEGRGRQGKSFFSPAGTGVYMSIVLRPDADEVPLFTTGAAVAVCRAISSQTSAEPRIKWVNDILVGGKKVCGILTEALVGSEGVQYVVLGIGVNVSTECFPCEIEGKVDNIISAGLVPSRNRMIAGIINEFFSVMREKKTLLEQYRTLSAVIGCDIVILEHGQKQKGHALDIDNDGGLVVLLESGEKKVLRSGEISIRGEFYND